MPVFGVRTYKKYTDGYSYTNRYWLNTGDLIEAASLALLIASSEAAGHTTECVIEKVHFWRPGANPNEKITVPTNVPGVISHSVMTKPQIVARMFFGTPSTSNPMYKDYRVRYPGNALAGSVWSSLEYPNLSQIPNEFAANGITFCTKTGTPLGVMSMDTEYHFRQLSKRWYNRSTP